MALDKLFHKAKKAVTPKSHTEKVLELRAQMSNLSSTLDTIIADNIMQVRQARNEGKSYHRAEVRVKNAYYTRMVLQNSMEDLDEVENDAQLAAIVNKTSRTIFRLNSMADFSPKVGEKFLQWQSDVLGGRMKEEAEKQSIPTREEDLISVPEDLIDRLLSGETISECLEGDRDFLNTEYSSTPAMAAEMQDIDGKFDELLKGMKQEI